MAEGSPAPGRTPQVSQKGGHGDGGQTQGSLPSTWRRSPAPRSTLLRAVAATGWQQPRPATSALAHSNCLEKRQRLSAAHQAAGGEEAARPIAPGHWRWHLGAMESPRWAPSPPCARDRLAQRLEGVSPFPKLTVSSSNPSGSPQRGWGPRAQPPDRPHAGQGSAPAAAAPHTSTHLAMPP